MKISTLSLMLFLLGTVCLYMTGCAERSKQTQRIATTRTDYEVVLIEACEYLLIDEGTLDQRVIGLSHKGNCRNPIHCYNEVLKNDTK